MAVTALEGFPVQYGRDVIQHLNEVIDSRSINNDLLKKIAEGVSPDAFHILHGAITSDGYHWFGRSQFRLDYARVAVLFPWSQDFNNPLTKLDRSINVYSDKDVSNKKIEDLLEQIAYQTAMTARLDRDESIDPDYFDKKAAWYRKMGKSYPLFLPNRLRFPGHGQIADSSSQ